jgi:hypothetical protein
MLTQTFSVADPAAAVSLERHIQKLDKSLNLEVHCSVGQLV